MAEIPGDEQAKAQRNVELYGAARKVAINMCLELGWDPFELVPYNGNRIPGELGNVVKGVAQRWETYYGRALDFIIGWRALQKFILTEQ